MRARAHLRAYMPVCLPAGKPWLNLNAGRLGWVSHESQLSLGREGEGKAMPGHTSYMYEPYTVEIMVRQNVGRT